MPLPPWLPLTLFAVAILAALLVGLRPSLTKARGGKVLAFVALFALPLLVTGLGTATHLEHSKSTEFCLSCHVMEPYGRSLAIDDSEYLPAVHFQNSLVDRDHACFDCHTSYTMYGDFAAKMRGLKHVWVNYLGTVPETIELYEPYQNRECLHCHGGARSFVENEMHEDDLEAMASGETPCLECHEFVHAVHELDELDTWEAVTP